MVIPLGILELPKGGNAPLGILELPKGGNAPLGILELPKGGNAPLGILELPKGGREREKERCDGCAVVRAKARSGPWAGSADQ